MEKIDNPVHEGYVLTCMAFQVESKNDLGKVHPGLMTATAVSVGRSSGKPDGAYCIFTGESG
jgi:hypothetical protein